MKKILPIVAMLLLCLGCAPPKKVSNSNTNTPSPLQEKKVYSNKQIAPGTCYISLEECKMDSDKNEIIGKISQIHGYGAGFTEVFQLDQTIVIKITKEDTKKIKEQNEISCVISQVVKMNDNSYLKLLEIKKH